MGCYKLPIKNKTNYDSNLSVEEWAIARSYFPPNDFGRPLEYDLREILNACLYLLRTGCQWRHLPKDFPPYNVVYYHFRRWRNQGLFEKMNADLVKMVRVSYGKDEEPSVVLIDSQSTKTSEQGGTKGYDAGKKIKGRKRHILTDTLGLLLGIVVHSADIQDRDGAKLVLEHLEYSRPRVELIIADGGYAGELEELVEELKDEDDDNELELKIVKRSDQAKGFEVIPFRWIVERTLAWISKNRRFSKDYEVHTATSVGRIQLAMIRIMLKRLAV
jgi:putative transposase